MKKEIICCVAGKSGGHIIPCLTILQNNITPNTESHILFFSSNTSLDKKILSNHRMVQWHIMLPLKSRTESVLKLICKSIYSFIISFFYLWKHQPKTIITTGGIVAIPTCLAGFILRIPITVYSLDAIPGKAIQFLIPLATHIYTCFSTSQHYFPAQKCSIAPYPIKYDLATDNIDISSARKNLQLHPDKKTILILGGSQGSLFLNEYMKQWINSSLFPQDKVQIIHQTGSLDTTDWNMFYKKAGIIAHVFSYNPHLAHIYIAADLIICRAGAGTLFEIKYFHKKSIIIPLSTHTTTHQIDNAYAMSQEYPELFQTIMQQEIIDNPTVLTKHIIHLL